MLVWICLSLPYLTAPIKLLIAYFNNAEVVNLKNWSRKGSILDFFYVYKDDYFLQV